MWYWNDQVFVRIGLGLAFSFALASCAQLSQTESASQTRSKIAKTKTASGDTGAAESSRSRHRSRVPAPIPTKPLEFSTACHFKNETGYGGEASIAVDDAQVKSFSARIDIPQRGLCQFKMEDFIQSQKLPTVELRAKTSPCLVRMWEQEKQIAVAFSNCRAECSPSSSFDYLWPILIDRPSGRCD